MLSWEYARLEADNMQKYVIIIISLRARKQYVSYFFQLWSKKQLNSGGMTSRCADLTVTIWKQTFTYKTKSPV